MLPCSVVRTLWTLTCAPEAHMADSGMSELLGQSRVQAEGLG